MSKRYLIFDRGAHSVVYFSHGETATDAIRRYIVEQNTRVCFEADGTLVEEGVRYPHPLAYIEAHYKVHGEWQIREVPDWAGQDGFSEIFCGESEDGPAYVIDECRPLFRQEFPRSRAKAFVWYLRQGALVTFYRRRGFQITVLRRYLWNWDGGKRTLQAWEGDYGQIVEALDLVPPRWAEIHLAGA